MNGRVAALTRLSISMPIFSSVSAPLRFFFWLCPRLNHLAVLATLNSTRSCSNGDISVSTPLTPLTTTATSDNVLDSGGWPASTGQAEAGGTTLVVGSGGAAPSMCRRVLQDCVLVLSPCLHFPRSLWVAFCKSFSLVLLSRSSAVAFSSSKYLDSTMRIATAIVPGPHAARPKRCQSVSMSHLVHH